jgi:carboxymethylenebutenolidase
MIERFMEIETPDGAMDTFVVHPELGGRYPAVVIFMDIWGLREELFDIARRVAAVGYHVTLPNTYYRQGKVRFEFRNESGQMQHIESLPVDVQEQIRDYMRALTDDLVVADAGTILKFLANEPVTAGPKGVLGYCMGGRHALAAAGHYPDDFRATVSLHGTRLVLDTPKSVHRMADRFKGEIYCGFAERDSLATPADIAALAAALSDRKNVAYEYVVHPDTDHGYSLPDRDIFVQHAANRDWERIYAMFRRQLQTGR